MPGHTDSLILLFQFFIDLRTIYLMIQNNLSYDYLRLSFNQLGFNCLVPFFCKIISSFFSLRISQYFVSWEIKRSDFMLVPCRFEVICCCI